MFGGIPNTEAPNTEPPLNTMRSNEQWQLNKYLWLCLLGLAVYLPFASKRDWVSVSLPAAYGILGLAVLNGAARTYSAWLQGGSNGPIGWLFTSVDILLISLGVALTGGIRSDLWLVYFVLMISEALYAPPLQTTALIGGMIAAYLAATWPAHRDPDYFVIAGTRLFFLVLVGAFARRISMTHERRNQELARLNEQVAASEERARIAREIHDGLGHALVASILRLELCGRLIRKKPEEAEGILKEEVPALRAAWNEGRNLAFHLRPWERDPAGFVQTVRRHLGRFAERTGIAVDFSAEPEDLNLGEDSELAVIRIIQEALTNVARHARANKVAVKLALDSTGLRCDIRDDGDGFDAQNGAEGFGLRAMRERAEKLGGSLSVKTAPREGTTVGVFLPA